MTALALLAVAIAAIYITIRVIRGPNISVRSVSELEALAYPIDLAALEELLSEEHSRTLDSSLTRHRRQIERRRRRLVITYFSIAAQNCLLLLRLGEAGQRSSNDQVRAAANEMVHAALTCRIACLMAIARYRLQLWFNRDPRVVVGKYRDLTNSVQAFVMASDPSRLSSALNSVAGTLQRVPLDTVHL